jgi:phage terminase large subunit-like protein
VNGVNVLDVVLKARLLAEKIRREDPLLFYNNPPATLLHEKQVLFHKCDKKNRWNFGGNRTGKTVCGAVEAVWFARGNHPYKAVSGATEGWVVSLTNEVQRDVAQKEILKWLSTDWIVSASARRGRVDDLSNCVLDYLIIKNVHGTNSRISFKACEQGRAKFQGTSQNWIWFDEEPPEDVYQECLMRVFDNGGYIWGTMTPLLGLTWVYDKIYKNENGNPEVWWQALTWEDNPYLPPDEVELMIASMPEKEREARQYGKFINSASALFGDFDAGVHIVPEFSYSRDYRFYMSIDYGFDMLACLWFTVDVSGVVTVFDELHIPNLMISEAAERILEKERFHLKLFGRALIKYTRYCPPDFNKRSNDTGREIWRVFGEHGVYFVKSVNARREGWMACRELFRVRGAAAGIYILVDCKVLIEHINKAVVDPDDPDDMLDDSERTHYISHILDAFRYFAVMYYGKPVVAVRESDLSRLKRKMRKQRRVAV